MIGVSNLRALTSDHRSPITDHRLPITDRHLRLPVRIRLHHLKDHLFAFTDDHGVKEGRHRFGVVAAAAAGEDQGVLGSAIAARSGRPARSSMFSTLV